TAGDPRGDAAAAYRGRSWLPRVSVDVQPREMPRRPLDVDPEQIDGTHVAACHFFPAAAVPLHVAGDRLTLDVCDVARLARANKLADKCKTDTLPARIRRHIQPLAEADCRALVCVCRA